MRRRRPSIKWLLAGIALALGATSGGGEFAEAGIFGGRCRPCRPRIFCRPCRTYTCPRVCVPTCPPPCGEVYGEPATIEDGAPAFDKPPFDSAPPADSASPVDDRPPMDDDVPSPSDFEGAAPPPPVDEPAPPSEAPPAPDGPPAPEAPKAGTTVQTPTAEDTAKKPAAEKMPEKPASEESAKPASGKAAPMPPEPEAEAPMPPKPMTEKPEPKKEKAGEKDKPKKENPKPDKAENESKPKPDKPKKNKNAKKKEKEPKAADESEPSSEEPPAKDDAEEADPAKVEQDANAEADEADMDSARLLFNGKNLKGWKVTDFGGEGKVEVADGDLMLGVGDNLTGVTYEREHPITNYEISLEAKRTEGNDFFCGLTFPVGKEFASLICGGWGGAVTGISCVDGYDASENQYSVYKEYENGKWYKIRVRVTDKHLKAWIDKELVLEIPRKDHEFEVRLEVEPSRPLGVASWRTGAAIREFTSRNLGEDELEESNDSDK